MRGLGSGVRLGAGMATAVVVAVFSACGQSERASSAGDEGAGNAGESSGRGGSSGSSASGGSTGGSVGGSGGTTAGSGGTTAGTGGAMAGAGGATAGSGGATAGSGGGGAGDAGMDCLQNCSMECACPRGTGFLPLVCVSPGDALCAGPGPPPSNCSTDANCADAGPLNICKQLPCNVHQCVPGCTTAQNCTGAEICGTNDHCTPKPCSTGDSCGLNHRCGISDFCERVPCERSADCDGVCVNRFCYDTAGQCGDPSAP